MSFITPDPTKPTSLEISLACTYYNDLLTLIKSGAVERVNVETLLGDLSTIIVGEGKLTPGIVAKTESRLKSIKTKHIIN